MKKTLFLTMFFLGMAVSVHAEEMKMDLTPYEGSLAFQQMKSLAGTWKGKKQMGEDVEDVTVEYRVTSNGSAVVEKLFPGTEHEMVSIYHDRAGNLSMTHYCSLGNQPEMDLASGEGGKLDFDFSDRSAIDVASEPHMHALTLSIEGKDKLSHSWSYYQEGKSAGNTVLALSRVS